MRGPELLTYDLGQGCLCFQYGAAEVIAKGVRLFQCQCLLRGRRTHGAAQS